MKSILVVLLPLVTSAACKSPNAQTSATKDLTFRDNVDSSRLEEVFTMDGSDVVRRGCAHPFNRDPKDCRFNEVRIPWDDLKPEIEKNRAAMINNGSTNGSTGSYMQRVQQEIRTADTEIAAYDKLLSDLAADASTAADDATNASLAVHAKSIEEKRNAARTKRAYFELAASLAENITDAQEITEEAVLAKIKDQLTSSELVATNRDGNVLFPISFSYSAWEGETAATMRAMKSRLQSVYAQANESERKDIALSYIAGPAFRAAWINVYNRSLRGIESPYNYGLNRLRTDPSHRLTSNGKTLIFAGEFFDMHSAQDVTALTASGQDRAFVLTKTPLAIEIRDLSCRTLFGDGARTATRDELVNAAKDIYKWQHFPKITGINFWAPLTIDGTKFGWGIQGWSSWIKESMRDENETYRLKFSPDRRYTTEKTNVPSGGHLFCIK